MYLFVCNIQPWFQKKLRHSQIKTGCNNFQTNFVYQQRFYKVFPGLTGPFKEAPSVPNHNHNKPVYLWNVPKVFFEQSTTFLVICFPFPSLFEMYCWHQIRNKHIFTKLYEVDEVKQLNITHSFPISLESGLYNDIVIIGGTSRLLLWHTCRH